METSPTSAEQTIVSIVGEKVALGPLHRGLIPLWVKWLNDFEVTHGTTLAFRPFTREAEEAWYETAVKHARSTAFAIHDRATMRPIGNADLHGIDHANRTAEFGIIIGDKQYWGKGYGSEVARLLLDYGFNRLGLNSILLRVYSFNERGIRAYTRAGFKVCGRWREAIRRGGRAYDVIFMDCLASEFRWSTQTP